MAGGAASGINKLNKLGVALGRRLAARTPTRKPITRTHTHSHAYEFRFFHTQKKRPLSTVVAVVVVVVSSVRCCKTHLKLLTQF